MLRSVGEVCLAQLQVLAKCVWPSYRCWRSVFGLATGVDEVCLAQLQVLAKSLLRTGFKATSPYRRCGSCSDDVNKKKSGTLKVQYAVQRRG